MTGGPGLGHTEHSTPHKQKFLFAGDSGGNRTRDILFVCLFGGMFDLGKRLF